MCEQLGQEPDPAKMPVSLDSFPEEVQWAFVLFNHLPDRWEGMSGSYLGKDWSPIQFFVDLYEIEDPKTVVFFTSKIDSAQKKLLKGLKFITQMSYYKICKGSIITIFKDI